jgi:hypothetical protein
MSEAQIWTSRGNGEFTEDETDSETEQTSGRAQTAQPTKPDPPEAVARTACSFGRKRLQHMTNSPRSMTADIQNNIESSSNGNPNETEENKENEVDTAAVPPQPSASKPYKSRARSPFPRVRGGRRLRSYHRSASRDPPARWNSRMPPAAAGALPANRNYQQQPPRRPPLLAGRGSGRGYDATAYVRGNASRGGPRPRGRGGNNYRSGNAFIPIDRDEGPLLPPPSGHFYRGRGRPRMIGNVQYDSAAVDYGFEQRAPTPPPIVNVDEMDDEKAEFIYHLVAYFGRIYDAMRVEGRSERANEFHEKIRNLVVELEQSSLADGTGEEH